MGTRQSFTQPNGVDLAIQVHTVDPRFTNQIECRHRDYPQLLNRFSETVSAATGRLGSSRRHQRPSGDSYAVMQISAK